MKAPPLNAGELEMLRAVFRRHPEIASATLFGSRAKGTHTERSDVGSGPCRRRGPAQGRGHRGRVGRASFAIPF